MRDLEQAYKTREIARFISVDFSYFHFLFPALQVFCSLFFWFGGGGRGTKRGKSNRSAHPRPRFFLDKCVFSMCATPQAPYKLIM